MALFSGESGYLGVDIGSTGIKIVELTKENGQAKLLSYGFSENKKIIQNNWQNNTSYVADLINRICDESGIIGRNAISALPTFAVFSSVLNLANVAKKDIPSAVHWEAKKVIPLPLDDMILDWKEIEQSEEEKKKKKNNIKVLLTGAPRALVKKHINIFKEAGMNLLSLETETFSLVRSLLGNDKSTIMLVEIGAGTSDISIIDKGIPIFSRSIDVGGYLITKSLSRELKISMERAEQFKYDFGISTIDSQDSKVPDLIADKISPIVNEIKYAINLFQTKNNKKTEKIVLSGASAFLPNLVPYLSKILDIKVIIGDPWARISYPVDLKPLLHQIGPRMSVAVGLAMREIE